MQKHTRATSDWSHGVSPSEHLWCGCFVRRSQGNAATPGRATAVGVDVLRL